MSIKKLTGNIFNSNCQVIVNTVNCVGVMGAGIALECRLRYPEMYKKYVQLCENNLIEIGRLWLYKDEKRWILNFPTKKHWKYPSRIEYLINGLEKFTSTYKDREINSIAFPLLGADKGGIPQETSLDLMMLHLRDIDIDVEIYKYDSTSPDDIYIKTKSWLLTKEASEVASLLGLRKNYVLKVMQSMQDTHIVQLNQLAKIDGIGIKTLEKIFALSMSVDHINLDDTNDQKSLF